DPKLERGERQVNGISAVAVGPGADDGRGGSVPRNRRPRNPEAAHRDDEQDDRNHYGGGAERRAHPRRDESERPSEMNCQTSGDRREVDERGPHDTEIGDFRSVARLLIASIASSHGCPATPNELPRRSEEKFFGRLTSQSSAAAPAKPVTVR